MTSDLAGMTVVDLAGAGPSARCVRVLADLGARWIRLEPPAASGRATLEWHAYGAMRGAERITFDLKRPGAAEVFLRLAEQADIVVEGFRPGVAKRLGIDYGPVSAANPGIIYCSTTGYGQTGAMASRAGHDLNYQSISGGLALSGRDAEGKPAMPGMTLADSAGGGWQAALRILAALVARQTTRRGQYLDVSAAEGVLHLLSLDIDRALVAGRSEPTVVNGGFACYSVYATADGGAVAVGAVETKFFANLCKGLGIEDGPARQYDAAAQSDLRAEIAAAFRRRTRDEWVGVFEHIDACVTPVLAIDELAAQPHWREREVFTTYTHPERGAVTQLVAFGEGTRGAAPASDGASFRDLMTSLRFTPEEIDAMYAAGIAG